MTRTSILSFVLTLAPVVTVAGKTFDVPSNAHPTVQSAIDAASPGDEIVIDGEHLVEGVTIATSGLTLRGKDGAALDAEYDGPCVRVIASDVTIEDLTLLNGSPAIEFKSSGLRVEDVLIRGARDFGIVGEGNDTTIRDCRVLGVDGQFLSMVAGAGSVTRIEDNEFRAGEGSISVIVGGQILFRDNEVRAYDSGFELHPTHPSKSSKVEKNSFSGLDGDAIRICVDAGVSTAGAVVRDNEISGCNGDGVFVEVQAGAAAAQVVIRENEIQGPGSDGISAEVFGAAPVEIEDNLIRDSANRSISAEGAGYTISDNELLNSEDGAMFLRDFAGSVIDNKIKLSGGAGIRLADTVGPVLIADNNVRECLFGGISVIAGTASIIGNKLVKNHADGIDIGGEASGVIIAENLCSKNAHEGIDNSGVATSIRDNKCFHNGGRRGPDIAGRGDGNGTVSQFDGNDFGIGGAATLQRLDV